MSIYFAMSTSKPSSVREVKNSFPDKGLEATPNLHQAYIEAGLNIEDADFLANFSDERRKKCVRKVSINPAIGLVP